MRTVFRRMAAWVAVAGMAWAMTCAAWAGTTGPEPAVSLRKLNAEDFLPAKGLLLVHVTDLPKAWPALFGDRATARQSSGEVGADGLPLGPSRRSVFLDQAAESRIQPEFLELFEKAGFTAESLPAIFPRSVTVSVHEEHGELYRGLIADIGRQRELIEEMLNKFWIEAERFYKRMPIDGPSEVVVDGRPVEIFGWKIRDVEISYAFVENLFILGAGPRAASTFIDYYTRPDRRAARLSSDPSWAVMKAEAEESTFALRADLPGIGALILRSEKNAQAPHALLQRYADLAMLIDSRLAVVSRTNGRRYSESYVLSARDPSEVAHWSQYLEDTPLDGRTLAYVSPDALFVACARINARNLEKFHAALSGRVGNVPAQRLLARVSYPIYWLMLDPKILARLEGEQTLALSFPSRPLRGRERSTKQWLAAFTIRDVDGRSLEILADFVTRQGWVQRDRLLKEVLKPDENTPAISYYAIQDEGLPFFYRAFTVVPGERSQILLLASNEHALEKALRTGILKTPNMGGRDDFARMFVGKGQARYPFFVYVNMDGLAQMEQDQADQLFGERQDPQASVFGRKLWESSRTLASDTRTPIGALMLRAKAANPTRTAWKIETEGPLSVARLAEACHRRMSAGGEMAPDLVGDNGNMRNLRTLWVALLLYARAHDTFPAKLSDLYPGYLRPQDLRALVRPGSAKLEEIDRGVSKERIDAITDYKYLPGRKLDDPGHRLVLYDAAPAAGSTARQFLSLSGAVINLTNEDESERWIKDDPSPRVVRMVEDASRTDKPGR